ncbi:MAG: pilin [Xanthomonadales bacterium]|nr:pilin [Xanthomonadales bacterium]
MRHALITFGASLLGAAIALFGWGAWQQREARLEREATEKLEREAKARGDALAATLAAEQRAIEAVRGDVVAASAARVAVAEYYMSNLRTPATNAEAGLPESAKYRGASLRSLSVGEGGRLVLTFDAVSGRDGGTIEFVPDLGGVEAMGMQWHCTTRDYPWIARALPSCELVEGQGTATERQSP